MIADFQFLIPFFLYYAWNMKKIGVSRYVWSNEKDRKVIRKRNLMTAYLLKQKKTVFTKFAGLTPLNWFSTVWSHLVKLSSNKRGCVMVRLTQQPGILSFTSPSLRSFMSPLLYFPPLPTPRVYSLIFFAIFFSKLPRFDPHTSIPCLTPTFLRITLYLLTSTSISTPFFLDVNYSTF